MRWVLTLLILITFSSYAVEGYLIEKIVEVRYAGVKHITGKFGACLPDAGSQLKEVKDFVTENAFIREEKVIESSGEVLRARSTSIGLLSKEGIITYYVDHDRKLFRRLLIPYKHFVNQLILEGEFLSLPVLCNYEKRCSLNKSFYKFTGREEKIVKWKAKEVVFTVRTEKFVAWIAKDKDLEEANLTILRLQIKAVERGLRENRDLLNLYNDAFQELQSFIKEHGAPVRMLKVDTRSYRFVKETVKRVERINIPESMFKPPKDYEEIKLPI